jgi:class 3 adenylate cyclase/tetratricopeptide (TPR) repeat protein
VVVGGAGGISTVTVLFTDLVSSTQIMNLLGDSVFDELRQSHLGLLGQAIAAHGGVEVKSLGDGVMAIFTAASDAVAAAVAMQQAVQRRDRRAPARLSMRVGLALGDATEHAGDWFGTPVVQAARLCAQCAGGQILVTDTVRAVAEAHTNAHFAPVGTVALRGLAVKVTIWKLDWVQMACPAAVALPSPFRGSEAFGFVGRQAELAVLAAAFERAAVGGRQVILVAGEPGVGKSRLAAEFAREVHARGISVLFGRCDEGLAMPYQPFVEALSHYLHHVPPAELPSRLGYLGGELVRLVPELAELVTGLPSPMRSDPEIERYRLFEAVASWLGAASANELERFRLFEAMASWLGAASADEPLLVVLDDLHWATEPTLLLLRHVVRATSAAQLLMVCIYRHTELDPAHSMANLQADLRRDAGVERLVVGGLDEAEVMALLEAIGRPLGDNVRGLARAIRDHTEGNAFFVGELVRHAVESGNLGYDSDGGLEHLGIPEGVSEVVLRRLRRLSEEANQALVTAAVVGAEFDLAVVAAVTALGEDAVAEALEQAMAAGLVKEVAGITMRFRFRHQLVRASLYSSLSTARRLRLHRRVGQAIEALYRSRLDDHLLALAHHFALAAADAEAATAVGYTWRAGDRALAQLAHNQAVELYTRALELFDSSELASDLLQRCDLLIALGEAQRRATHPAYYQTLLVAAAIAQQVGDVDRLVTAALANTGITWLEDRHEQVAVLTAALAAISDDDSPLRARLLANLAGSMLLTGEWDQRVTLSEQAVTMARRLGDPSTLAQVLIPVLRTLRHPSTLAERLDLVTELAELAERLGDANVGFSVALYGIGAALEAGDIALAQRRLADATRLADDLTQPALRWAADISHVALTVLAGHVHDGERLAHQALEVGGSANYPEARLFFGVQLLAIRIVQDRLGELKDLVAEFVTQHPSLWAWQPVLALCHCELSHWDEARVVFQRLAADDFASRPYDVNWLAGIALSAEVCAELGDVSAAAVLFRLLTPYADQFVTAGPVTCLGSVARYLGRLAATMGRLDEAHAHFTAAAAAQTRIDAPAWLARTQLDWANLLLNRGRHGDTQMATKLLDQTLATARQLDLSTLEQRAVTLSRRECLGARARKRPGSPSP